MVRLWTIPHTGKGSFGGKSFVANQWLNQDSWEVSQLFKRHTSYPSFSITKQKILEISKNVPGTAAGELAAVLWPAGPDCSWTPLLLSGSDWTAECFCRGSPGTPWQSALAHMAQSQPGKEGRWRQVSGRSNWCCSFCLKSFTSLVGVLSSSPSLQLSEESDGALILSMSSVNEELTMDTAVIRP